MAGYRVPGTDVGSCSGTWYLDLGFQKSVALFQACPAEPESTGARCEALALEGGRIVWMQVPMQKSQEDVGCGPLMLSALLP